jgi:cytochrome c oxidase subunit 2
MALTPPSERIWWKEPIAKIELIWIVVAFLWGLTMFFMMIYWHGAGEQNLSSEAYRITPERFAERTQAMIDQYTVREENGFPVVKPPPGSDVYLLARLWQWSPILELEKDQSYRFHLASVDWQHGFSLHQYAGTSGLRDGVLDDTGPCWRVRHRLQRVLRDRPPPDGRQDLRGRVGRDRHGTS